MSQQALETASSYLNNLLLVRGLLQDGKPIDFALGNGGSSTSTSSSRIINLVHDLILRRDRESEQREILALTIRDLRAEETQRVLDLQKLQDRNIRVQSEAAKAEAQERSHKAAVKRVELQMRDLREQVSRLKSTLDQVRAKCISDVRKRDLEIEKLRSHLAGTQRGKKETGGMKINVLNSQGSMDPRRSNSRKPIQGSEWSLENETNDFLAALVNETSTENVALRKIVNDTMEYLRSLSELEDAAPHEIEDDGIGIPGQYRKSRIITFRLESDGLVPVQDLGSQMTAILEHCRTILKDPSFVPIEEVEIRDEEILKLRAGWEKMADRWKDAVKMMSQWRQNMMEGGEHMNMEQWETLKFDRSAATRPDGRHILTQIDEEEISSMIYDHPNDKLEQMHEGGQVIETSVDSHAADEKEEEKDESELELSGDPQTKRLAASPAKRGLQLQLQRRTESLTPTAANVAQRPPNEDRSFSRSADSGIGSVDENDYSEDFPLLDKHQPQEVRRTIKERLAAVEAEANEATEQLRTRQATTQNRKMSDRVRKSRKMSRRRSTLDPEQLAELING